MNIQKSNITAIILAGGKARRMDGRDKALIPLVGKPMLSYLCEAVKPQVGSILINSNRPADDYRDFELPVVADSLPGFLGPLAGLLTAFDNSNTEYVLTIPCDTPLLPSDLVQRLSEALIAQNADIATVSENGHLHAAIMLAHRNLAGKLKQYLDSGERRVQGWLKQQNLALADYTGQAEAFFNINSPQDLAQIEQHWKTNRHGQ